MIRIMIVLAFYFISAFVVFGQTDIVSKVFYKKVVLDYNQPSLINVVLNNNKNISNVVIYFNSENITSFNKEDYIGSDFIKLISSINFEVTCVRQDSNLEIYFEFQDGTVNSYEALLSFEKGFILTESNLTIGNNRIFFISADFDDDDVNDSFEIEIANPDVVMLLEDVDFNSKHYFKVRSRGQGGSIVKVLKSEDEVDNGKPYINNIFYINVIE